MAVDRVHAIAASIPTRILLVQVSHFTFSRCTSDPCGSACSEHCVPKIQRTTMYIFDNLLIHSLYHIDPLRNTICEATWCGAFTSFILAVINRHRWTEKCAAMHDDCVLPADCRIRSARRRPAAGLTGVRVSRWCSILQKRSTRIYVLT